MGFKVIYILGKIPFDSMLNVKIVPAFKTGWYNIHFLILIDIDIGSHMHLCWR